MKTKNRTWSTEEKRNILQEAAAQGFRPTAAKHSIQTTQLYAWKRKLNQQENPAPAQQFEFKQGKPQSKDEFDLRVRVRQLERIIGRQTVELELLRERTSS